MKKVSWGWYGNIEQLDTTLAPQYYKDGSGSYDHYFSGSIIEDSDIIIGTNFKRRIAFLSAVSAEKGFMEQADTLLVTSCDERMDSWGERVRITDQNTFRGAWDQINKTPIDQLYDVRDPNVTYIKGRMFMVLAGTKIPNRQGQSVISLLIPDSKNINVPWKYVGNIYCETKELNQGGAGIIECPRLQSFTTSDGSTKEILIFSRQRRELEGPLDDRQHHESVEAIVGTFNIETFEFKPELSGLLDYSAKGATYATTSFTDAVGNLVLASWVRAIGDGKSWSGVCTLRTLQYTRNGIELSPHDSITKLRELSIKINNQHLKGEECLASGRTFDLCGELVLAGDTPAAIDILCDVEGRAGIRILFDGRNLFVGNQFIDLGQENKTSVSLRVIADCSLIEVYANGKVLTYLDEENSSLERAYVKFAANGIEAKFNYLSLYVLRSAYQE